MGKAFCSWFLNLKKGQKYQASMTLYYWSFKDIDKTETILRWLHLDKPKYKKGTYLESLPFLRAEELFEFRLSVRLSAGEAIREN